MNWILRSAVIFCAALAPAVGFAQDKFFNSNGVQIRYLEQGEGEPIVLVHGNGGSLQTWVSSGVLENLATDYGVIALDCRGHGKSGKPHDAKQYGREMALDIVRLLDHLRIRRAHVVGYSMGANITAQLLTMHPDRFLTATLVAGAGRFRWTPEDDRLAEQDASEIEQGFNRSQVLRLSPTDEPKPTEEEIRKRSTLNNPNVDRQARAALTRARRDLVITPAQVAAVTVPTLGIAGSADPLLAALQELKKLRPALKLVVIEGATHAGERGIIRRSEFLPVVREFIASHRAMPSR